MNAGSEREESGAICFLLKNLWELPLLYNLLVHLIRVETHFPVYVRKHAKAESK